jgi:hypothetical protein
MKTFVSKKKEDLLKISFPTLKITGIEVNQYGNLNSIEFDDNGFLFNVGTDGCSSFRCSIIENPPKIKKFELSGLLEGIIEVKKVFDEKPEAEKIKDKLLEKFSGELGIKEIETD